MPKINKYKIVNFKYGKSGNRLLSDKVIVLNGDHLQMEATNSVGKSMSIQTLIQAICPLADVDKKFIDVYNVKEPIYSVIEWILDDNKTKLLTGIGFEKKNVVNLEDGVKDKKSNLYKLFTFVIEENSDLNVDIENIPFYQLNENKVRTLKSLSSMENYIKSLKSKFPDKVATFSQNSSAQSKYRDKLAEYGIYQSEWKEILIKLNGGEAVLSSFFEEYNTTEKFIKNKVLPLIDNNLNKDSDKNSPIKQLREQVKKFIEHCIKMDDKIKCYNDYSTLLEYTTELKMNLTDICNIEDDINSINEELSKIYYYCVFENEKTKKEINDFDLVLKNLEEESVCINYEEACYDYHMSNLEIDKLSKVISSIEEKISDLNTKIDDENEKINILKYQDLNKKLKKENEDLAKKESERELLTLENEEISKKIDDIGYSINQIAKVKEIELNEKLSKINETISNTNDKIKSLNKEKNEFNNDIKTKEIEVTKLNIKIKDYKNRLSSFNKRYNDIDLFKEITLSGEVVNYGKYISKITTDIENIYEEIGKLENKIIDIESKEETLKNDNLKYHTAIKDVSNEIINLEQKLKKIIDFEEELFKIITQHEINKEDMDNYKNISSIIEKTLLGLQGEKNKLTKNKIEKENELNSFKNISNIAIDDKLIELLASKNIEVDFGFNYLVEMNTSLENKITFINKCPLLPYSIIINKSNLEKLKKLETDYKTKFSTPILIRETLEDLILEKSNSIVSINDFNLLLSFDINLLDNNKRKESISKLELEIEKIKKNELFITEQIDKLKEIEFKSNDIKYSIKDKLSLELKIDDLNNSKKELDYNIKSIAKELKKLSIDKEVDKDNLKSKQNNLLEIKSKLKEINELHALYQNIEGLNEKIVTFEKEIEFLNTKIEKHTNSIDEGYNSLNGFKILANDLNKEKLEVTKLKNTYQLYTNGTMVKGSIEELLIMLNELKNNSVVKNIEDLTYDINNALNRKLSYENDMNELKEKIKTEDILGFIVMSDKNTLSNNIKNLKIKRNEIISDKEKETKKLNKEEGALEHKHKQILKKFKKEVISLEDISNYDFKKRRSNVKNQTEITKGEIVKLKDKQNELELLIRDVKKYKGSNMTVVEMDFTKISNQVDMLIKELDSKNEAKFKLTRESSKIRDKIIKFNLSKNEQYDLMVTNLTADEILVNSQLERISKVELVLEEEISKVESYKDDLDIEKNAINKQIKDYLSDCIDELKVINKLGRVNGETLFTIVLPDDDKINYLIIEEIIESLYENKDIDNIDSIINSFYLLNKLINIGNLKIKVVQYELNNKKEIVYWDKVIKSTSGGQRFCISFIILTILMEYKRHDSKELFHKSTGKVLIMDNPFGETSEEDFLRLVFKLANKFNVQIVSYTHVTNASIRAQFNRIYRMMVELTSNNKELVVIEEDKNSDIDEFVNTANYVIYEKSNQHNLFDYIK